MSTLLFKRLSSFAYTPTRATAGSIGYDLRSAGECIIKAHDRAVINTISRLFYRGRRTGGLQLRVGYVLSIRSTLALV